MYDVLIVGAGPCGIATAAVAQRAELDYVVLERGCIVNSLVGFPTNMTFFSTSDKLAVAGVPFLTPKPNPTRQDALNYYRQVADALALNIRLYTEVIHVQPEAGGFTVKARPVHDHTGQTLTYRARALVLATGYFDSPNRLDVPGAGLPKVSHYFTEAHPYYRQKVVVVGARNSAVEAALELLRAGAEVTLVHRGADLSDRIKPWILPFIRKALEKGEIKAHFNSHVREIHPDRVVLDVAGRKEELPNDFVFALTGFRADQSLLVSLGVKINPATGEPVYDPKTQETNVSGLYVAGVLAAGYDANKIFIENGRFHGERIVSHLLRERGMSPEQAEKLVRFDATAAMRSGETGVVDF